MCAYHARLLSDELVTKRGNFDMSVTNKVGSKADNGRPPVSPSQPIPTVYLDINVVTGESVRIPFPVLVCVESMHDI